MKKFDPFVMKTSYPQQYSVISYGKLVFEIRTYIVEIRTTKTEYLLKSHLGIYYKDERVDWDNEEFRSISRNYTESCSLKVVMQQGRDFHDKNIKHAYELLDSLKIEDVAELEGCFVKNSHNKP